MNRKFVDKIASTTGLLLAVVLLAAGALLTWGYDFANNQVKTQLAAQQITFPAADSGALKSLPQPDQGIVAKFAGQQLLTGRQAQVFADNYIAVHLKEIAGGKTYSQESAASLANPSDTALANTVNVLFKGETLRGMLLNAYAFWQLGQIAMYSAMVSFLGGVLFIILALLGFRRVRKVGE